MSKDKKVDEAVKLLGDMEDKGFQITPAALGAFVKGDVSNFLTAAIPGGVEAQEVQGQTDFVASETLPRELLHGTTREQLESLGIIFGGDIDDIFVEVKLPDGWKKVPTEHSMWSELLDDKGRARAQIFYKAAFYDRRAHLDLMSHFSYGVQPVCGWQDPNCLKHEWHGVVMDGDMIIWVVKTRLSPQPDISDDELMRKWYQEQDALRCLAHVWLMENYPDWENPLAYWD